MRSFQLRSQVPGARMDLLFARHGRCSGSMKIDSSQSSSIVEFGASRFSILVFLDSERLCQFCSMLQAIHDVVWKSFELLSISGQVVV